MNPIIAYRPLHMDTKNISETASISKNILQYYNYILIFNTHTII